MTFLLLLCAAVSVLLAGYALGYGMGYSDGLEAPSEPSEEDLDYGGHVTIRWDRPYDWNLDE